MKNNVITVVVMTYNHKDYIVKAIQSIICQKIDVGFSILVHDDCSDDGTYELLLDLQEKNPNIISIIRQNSRKYPSEGFNRMILNHVVPAIESKFIAYCDGDDYWIDEYKLKKQYDFMIKNSNYSMCFHPAYQLRDNNDLSSKWFFRPEGDIDLSDIIGENVGVCVATSSIFVKSEVFKTFPNWRLMYPVEDVPLYIYAALTGKIHCLKDIMCVYRQFSFGSWSAQNKNNDEKTIKHLLNMKEAIERFDSETHERYHSLVIIQINAYYFRIALLEKKYSVIFEKKNKKFFKKLPAKERISLFLQYKAPRFYKLIKRH